MRTFYSEYVQHCMRFYARHPRPKFRSDADKQNWNACDSAMKGFTDKEQDILMTVYREGAIVYTRQDTAQVTITESERRRLRESLYLSC